MNSEHNLDDNWVLYIHYPNDTNWNISSYKKIAEINTIEKAIVLFNMISEDLYSRCMFFLMRNDIIPMWEQPENKNGGAYSFKVDVKCLKQIWKSMCYQAIGESVMKNAMESKNVNGITLSPKKNFAIIKIWTANCEMQDPTRINYFENITSDGCIFKKHIS